MVPKIDIVRLLKTRFSDGFSKYISRSLFLAMSGFLVSAISASSTIYFLPMYIMFGFSVAVVELDQREKRIENFAS